MTSEELTKNLLNICKNFSYEQLLNTIHRINKDTPLEKIQQTIPNVSKEDIDTLKKITEILNPHHEEIILDVYNKCNKSQTGGSDPEISIDLLAKLLK